MDSEYNILYLNKFYAYLYLSNLSTFYCDIKDVSLKNS